MAQKQKRFSGQQKAFIGHMARTHNKEYAATKAGYASPAIAGWKLMENPLIANAVRSECQKALEEKLGPAAVYNLAEIALDVKMPAGARVKASEILMKASGLGVQEGGAGKELHEMTGDELRHEIQRMEATQAAMTRALSDQAKPVIEGDDIAPIGDAFG